MDAYFDFAELDPYADEISERYAAEVIPSWFDADDDYLLAPEPDPEFVLEEEPDDGLPF